MSLVWFGADGNSEASSVPLDDCVSDRRSALLYIGSVNHLNGIEPARGNGHLLLVSLPAVESSGPYNTLLLPLRGDSQLSWRLVDMDCNELADGTVRLDRLFLNMQLGPDVRQAIAARLGAQAARAMTSFAPIFYTSWKTAKEPDYTLHCDLHIYSQTRFSPDDVLFMRTSPKPYTQLNGSCERLSAQLELSAGNELSCFDEAVRLHALDPVFLNNHQCYYKKCFAGKELENKLNMKPPVDIWGLNIECYNRIRAGAMPGYIPEYRDEFQAWDYFNHVYEIPEPAEEQGYISFIPTTDGRYTLKRKWYAKDQFIRRESLTKGIDIKIPLDQHIRERHGVEPVSLGSFRRVRYDVNFESVRTGHVYGIFFDHCSIVGAEDIVLSQCEIEYLRSRTRLDPDEDIIYTELENVTAWTRNLLDELGVKYVQGFYSKLSFLRDNKAVVAARAGKGR